MLVHIKDTPPTLSKRSRDGILPKASVITSKDIPKSVKTAKATNTAHTKYAVHDTEDVKADVDKLLQVFYDSKVSHAHAIDRDYGLLWEAMSSLAFAGGKRLRPYLTVLAYEMYGGRDYDAILPIAAAQEILHLSLLIHDDITDRDQTRYGVDNISGKYRKSYGSFGANPDNALHYAESAALLAGDLLLSAAHAMVLETGLPDSIKMQLHTIIGKTVFDVAAGQFLDMESGMRSDANHSSYDSQQLLANIQLTDALKIARLKTASYSFVGPMKSGALAAQAPLEDMSRLVTLGETLGVAFQMMDDLIGVFGDPDITGKSNLTDIKEGKHTYLMQRAFALATPKQLTVLQQYFGKHTITDFDADTIREIIIDSGAKASIENSLSAYHEKAEKMASLLQISSQAHGDLLKLITIATHSSMLKL